MARLEPVTGKPITVHCMGCSKAMQTDRETVLADLDGESFKAYFCKSCATAIKSKGQN